MKVASLESPSTRPATVGILFPGEMGTAIGQLLIDRGISVVTTLEGRSARTCQQAQVAGFRIVDSLGDVAAISEIVISLVPPAAAFEVAVRYAESSSRLPASPLYVDANSISRQTTRRIGRRVRAAGADFVDAAIHGLASRLREQGTLYLSGSRAEQVAGLFGSSLHSVCLGDEPGAASMLKMLMGGLSKGLVSLFLEIGLTAHQAGLLSEFLGGCQQYYPGVMTVLERLLPTYARHSERRADEIAELNRTMRGLELRPGVTNEVERLLRTLGSSGLERRQEEHQAAEGVAPNIAELIELISRENPLQSRQAAPRLPVDRMN